VHVALEDIDLAELTAQLRDRLRATPLIGYLDGRTVMRDAVAEQLDCSELEAEQIVDTMVARGFAHFEGDPKSAVPEEPRWLLA
jgi:hypothetical protein